MDEQNITIRLVNDSPIKTIKKFAQDSGLTESSVNNLHKKGFLPVLKMGDSVKSRVMINNVKLIDMCMRQQQGYENV